MALLPAGCLLLELRVFMAVPCAQPPGCFMAAVFLQPRLRRARPLRASGGHSGMRWAPELPVKGRGWVVRSGPGVPRDREALRAKCWFPVATPPGSCLSSLGRE